MTKLGDIKWRRWKRAFDIIGSMFLLGTVLWWLIPMIIVLQKLLNPGPLFFKTCRSGCDGREFVCYKFRSMVAEAEKVKWREHQATNGFTDNRITQFGQFLRNRHFDELPQFFNVMKGETSIVGPRPHDIRENTELLKHIPTYHRRQRIRPGLTGWAQVNGYRGTTTDIDQMRIRTEYDLWYIGNWSFVLDLKIILRTAWIIAKGDPQAI
jgi:putative colanic acid biosysnthesis UDP-glucose lipid carrier transferase